MTTFIKFVACLFSFVIFLNHTSVALEVPDSPAPLVETPAAQAQLEILYALLNQTAQQARALLTLLVQLQELGTEATGYESSSESDAPEHRRHFRGTHPRGRFEHGRHHPHEPHGGPFHRGGPSFGPPFRDRTQDPHEPHGPWHERWHGLREQNPALWESWEQCPPEQFDTWLTRHTDWQGPKHPCPRWHRENQAQWDAWWEQHPDTPRPPFIHHRFHERRHHFPSPDEHEMRPPPPGDPETRPSGPHGEHHGPWLRHHQGRSMNRGRGEW